MPQTDTIGITAYACSADLDTQIDMEEGAEPERTVVHSGVYHVVKISDDEFQMTPVPHTATQTLELVKEVHTILINGQNSMGTGTSPARASDTVSQEQSDRYANL